MTPATCKQRRKALRWSQAELSRRAGIGRSSAMHYENEQGLKDSARMQSYIAEALAQGEREQREEIEKQVNLTYHELQQLWKGEA